MDERLSREILDKFLAILSSHGVSATRFLRKVENASDVIRVANTQFVGGCQAGKRYQIAENMHDIVMHKPIDTSLRVLAPGEMPPPITMDDTEMYREEGMTLTGKRRFVKH